MNKTIENLGKGICGIVVGGTVGSLIVYAALNVLKGDNILTPRDFDKTKWIKFCNPSEKIYDSYFYSENIPHNTSNLDLYRNKVREKRKKAGTFLLPDLDGDGKVGKNLNINNGEN